MRFIKAGPSHFPFIIIVTIACLSTLETDMAATQWDKYFPNLKKLCEQYQNGRKLQEVAQSSTDSVVKSIWEWFEQIEAEFWRLDIDQREKLEQLNELNYLRLNVPLRMQAEKPAPAQPQPDREKLVNSVIRGVVDSSGNGAMIPPFSFLSRPTEPPRVTATLSYAQLNGADMNGANGNKMKSKPISTKKKAKNGNSEDVWWNMYALLLQYHEDYGDFDMEDDCIVEQDGIEYELGAWVKMQQEWMETYIEYCPERYKKLEELVLTKGLFGIIEPEATVNNDDKLYFEVLGHVVAGKAVMNGTTTRAASYFENGAIATNTPRHRLQRMNESGSSLVMQQPSSSLPNVMRGNAVGPAASSSISQSQSNFIGISTKSAAVTKSIQVELFDQPTTYPVAGHQKRKSSTNNRADRKKEGNKQSKKRRGFDSDEEEELDESEVEDEAMDGDESASRGSDSEDEGNKVRLNEAFWKNSSSSVMLRADNKDGSKMNQKLPRSSKCSSKSQPKSVYKSEPHSPDSQASLISEASPAQQSFKAVLYQDEKSNIYYMAVGLVVNEIRGAKQEDTIFDLKILSRLHKNGDYFQDHFELSDQMTRCKMEQVLRNVHFCHIGKPF